VRGIIRFCPRCGGKTRKKTIGETKRDSCPSCDEVFYDNPLSAVAIVAEKDGRVVFIKRNIQPAKGMWALPGGFIEQGESVEKAALRELREETGLKAKKAEVIKVVTAQSLFFRTLIIIGVKATGLTGKMKAGDDAGDARWYDINRTPAVTFPAHKLFVKEVRRKF
jgi:ADP-ribose pyrophosphatase YjhB (NUDIX family)